MSATPFLPDAGETPPAGAAEPAAGKQLRQAARQAIAERGSAKGGAGVVLKDVFIVLHWVAWYGLALHLGQSHIALAAVLAIPAALSLVAIMFGVMHDGSHRSISNTGLWNRLGSWTLILGGASAISWRQEHVVRHHGQTNVLHEDPDLESGGWLRFHPSQAWRPLHRWQHLYAVPLYSLVALRWIWFEDFDDLFHNRYKMAPAARWQHFGEILLAKACHALLFLAVPALLWGPASMAAFYVVQMLVVGLAMSLTFVIAHIGDAQDMYENVAARPDWTHSQLASTADFAVGNRLVGFFLGGLNFQIEHHLFPSTSPKHYPRLHAVVKEWAAAEGVPCHVFPTVRAALAAHFRHLASLSKPRQAAPAS